MPFGKYKDFDECVRKNADKEDPKAYCGKIKAAVEDSMPQEFRVRTTITHSAELDAFEEVDGRMFARLRILKAGTSKNRRTWPPHIVKEAVDKKLFDGILMFQSHDRKRPEAGDRNWSEMVSAIESTEWDDGQKAMDGRVEFFDRPFYEKVQRAKDYIGVSVNALVRGTRRVISGETFEDVTGWIKPRTVDWVFNPAAGGAILAFEDEDDEDMAIDWSKVTAEDLKKNAKEVYESIIAEASPTSNDDPPPTPQNAPTSEQIQKMVAEGVQKELQARETETTERNKKRREAGEKVREAFANSGLPERTRARVMASFEDIEEFDEAAVAESIKTAKEELQAAGAGPQIKGMGPSGASGSPDDEVTMVAHESVASAFRVPRPKKTEGDDAEGGTK